jgi:hypothetical protein
MISITPGEVNLMGRPPYGARATCESCKSIDVRHWHREGLLSAGQYFTCSWRYSSGEKSGSINVRTERDAVVLTYQTCHGLANDWKSISQRVPITWTDCHFGGQRPWFICNCGRRVAVLYGVREYFACRHCYELAYESQQEPIRWRGLIKAHKILTRLGAKPNVFDPFPNKPPRMHWRTYQRLHRAYEIAKDHSIRGVLGWRGRKLS